MSNIKYFTIIADDERIIKGIGQLCRDYAFRIGAGGRKVVFRKGEEFSVKSGIEITISYTRRNQCFPGFIYALFNEKDKVFEMRLDTLTFLLDASRNGVIRLEFLYGLIRRLAVMGYTDLQLYTEDTYTIESEPYFGHLRGRYTPEEINSVQEYAGIYGIELVPCIQTLAHLNGIFKWPDYSVINDCNDIMLAEDENTYALIEKMFASISKQFISRKVNAGMDEALMLGLGKYLEKNGYTAKYQIMLRHISRVKEIAGKYGFKLMMWSDMFFRVFNNGDYYIEKDKPLEIPQSVINDIPPDTELIYWDYYHDDSAVYDKMLEKHAELNRKIIFAPGAWRWGGFTPLNWSGMLNSRAALSAMEKHKNIKDVIVTAWGDDGSECPVYAVLPEIALFGLYNCHGVTDDTSLRKFFKETLNALYDDFMALDDANNIDINFCQAERVNPSKYMFYNDPLLGMFDYYEKPEYAVRFSDIAGRLDAAKKRNSPYGYIFRQQQALADFLRCKVNLGNEITAEYNQIVCNSAGDKAAEQSRAGILKFVPRIKEAKRALKKFIYVFGLAWEEQYKPFGKEIMDIRLSGLLTRFDILMRRISDFAAGKIDRIAELEEPRLPYCKGSGQTFVHFYKNIASPNNF